MTRTLVILALLVALVYCDGSCRWCKDPTGQNCRPWGVSSVEDEEVVNSWTENETEVLKRKKHAPPPVTNPNQCASSCDWISHGGVKCSKCNFAWALYPIASAPSRQCITQENGIWMLKNSPESVYKYTQLCESNGKCKCSQTTFFSSAFARRFSAAPKLDTKHCHYTCKSLKLNEPAGKEHWAKYIRIRLGVEKLVLHRDMLNGECPKLNTKGKFKLKHHTPAFVGELQDAIKEYCKYAIAENAAWKFPLRHSDIYAWKARA